jgi:hypothetical protein
VYFFFTSEELSSTVPVIMLCPVYVFCQSIYGSKIIQLDSECINVSINIVNEKAFVHVILLLRVDVYLISFGSVCYSKRPLRSEVILELNVCESFHWLIILDTI